MPLKFIDFPTKFGTTNSTADSQFKYPRWICMLFFQSTLHVLSINILHFNCIILTSCFRADSFCYIFPSASKPPGKSNRAIFCFHKIRTTYDRKLFFRRCQLGLFYQCWSSVFFAHIDYFLTDDVFWLTLVKEFLLFDVGQGLFLVRGQLGFFMWT